MIHWQPRGSGRSVVVATILAIILGTTSVHAGWVYIEGTLDCGMWTKARGEQVATALEQYVLGLLNGLSLGHGIDFWRADGWVLSRDAVYAWMDNYCQKNQLEDVVPATVQLYKERSGWRPAVTTSSSIYVNPRPGK